MSNRLRNGIVLAASLFIAPVESQAIPVDSDARVYSADRAARSAKTLEEAMYDYHKDLTDGCERIVKKAFYQGGFFDPKGYCPTSRSPDGVDLPVLEDSSNGRLRYPAFDWGECAHSQVWDSSRFRKSVATEIQYEFQTRLPKMVDPQRGGYFIRPRNDEIVSKIEFSKDRMVIRFETDFLVTDFKADWVYSVMGVFVDLPLPAGAVFEALDYEMRKSQDQIGIQSIRIGGLELRYFKK